MNAWWRMAVAVVATIGLMTLSVSAVNQSEPLAATPSVAEATSQFVPGVTLSLDSPPAASAVPPTQPTRLDIGGAFPIHAQVLPYGGSVLEPPGGNYHDAFLWTQRGLPGNGATDTTYIFGHTFAGPTPGVFDHLQLLSIGATMHLTTKTERLQYRLVKLLPASETDAMFQKDPRIWTVAPLEQRGDYVVLIACLLNTDGSLQTGKKIIAIFQLGE